MAWYLLKKRWANHDAGEKIEMDSADGKSLVDTGYADVVNESPEADIIKNVAESVVSRIGDSIVKSVDAALDTINTGVKRPRIDPGLQSDDKTKSFGDFLIAISAKDENRITKVYGAKAALAEGSGTTGGYTVPPEFYNRLLAVSAENAFVRSLATVLTMNGRSIQVPALDQTQTLAAGISPFYGGLQAQWVDEAGSRPETEPTFKQIELVAHELSGFVPASRTLLADSGIALDQLLTEMFGRAIAWTEEYGFLQGDGVGKPKGIIPSAATISVTRGTASHFTLVDAAKMWSKLLPGSMSRAVWIMSQSVIPDLIQLSDASNRVVFMPNPSATGSNGGPMTNSMPMTLLGRPIYFTEKLPALGTAGDVLLCDLSQYLVAERGTIEIATSDQYLFRTNQIAWRFIKRVDGQPWLDRYITYADGSTTVSPFVKLS